MPRRLQARRRGFTLTEILVVIGLIAVLVALISPAVVRARGSARNAVIRKEIDQLHQAMVAYGTTYGAYPPGYAPGIVVGGTLKTGTDAATRHLTAIFPACASLVVAHAQAAGLTYRNRNGNSGFPACANLSPDIALSCWLWGYTDDPTRPVLLNPNPIGVNSGTIAIVGQTVFDRQKMYDFDQARLINLQVFYPPRLPGSPYIYLDNGSYGSVNAPTEYVIGSGTYRAEVQVMGTGSAFFNPNTFQILCAGQDGVWGTPDDLSNFWKRTRQEYLESGK